MNNLPERLEQLDFSQNSRQREKLRARLLSQASAQLPGLIKKEKWNMHVFTFVRLTAIAAAVIVFTLFVNWLVGSFVPVPASGGTPTPAPDINRIVTATFQAMTQEARQTAEAMGTPMPVSPSIIAATLSAVPSATSITASLTLEPSTIPAPSFQSEDWVSFTHDKPWGSLQGFILHYPQSWLLTTKTYTPGEGNPQMILTLEKSGFAIKIGQFAGSEGHCLYPEDPVRDGFFSLYGEYTEIMKGDGIVWRRAVPIDDMRYGMFYKVCELNPDSKYINPYTKIGVIELQGPTQDGTILSEFDEILRKIEILK
jgi:hypothetical protein